SDSHGMVHSATRSQLLQPPKTSMTCISKMSWSGLFSSHPQRSFSLESIVHSFLAPWRQLCLERPDAGMAQGPAKLTCQPKSGLALIAPDYRPLSWDRTPNDSNYEASGRECNG